MKRKYLIFFIAIFGVVAVHAQTDTIQDRRIEMQWKPAVGAPSDAKEDHDFILVANDKLPATLRQALLNDIYGGWENAGVYQNKETGDYRIEIKAAGATKKYHFDQKGQPITSLGSSPNANPN